jgi:hypothetical protein
MGLMMLPPACNHLSGRSGADLQMMTNRRNKEEGKKEREEIIS